MTHFLSPAFEALEDTSLHSGMVVGLKADIVVGVGLLPGHKHEDSGTLSLHQDIKEGNSVVGL